MVVEINAGRARWEKASGEKSADTVERHTEETSEMPSDTQQQDAANPADTTAFNIEIGPDNATTDNAEPRDQWAQAF